MRAALGGRRERRMVAVGVGLVFIVLCALAVEFLAEVAVGALLGLLVLLVTVGVLQQREYAHRAAAERAAAAKAVKALDRRLIKLARDVTALSRDVTALSGKVSTASNSIGAARKDVAGVATSVKALSKEISTLAREIRMVEVESGVAALNRYVALGTGNALDRD